MDGPLTPQDDTPAVGRPIARERQAFLPERRRFDRLRRGLPAPARAPPGADAVARPRRSQGRTPERQARPVGGVRRLPRLRARRRPAPARLERLRAPRAALRQAVHRGGGRHRHPARRRLGVDDRGSAAEAPVRQASRRGPRLHRARQRGPGDGQRPDRPRGTAASRDARLGPGLPPAGRPVGHRTLRRPDRPPGRRPPCRGPAPRQGRRHPPVRPARSGRRPGHPRARRDGLGADRPPRPVARGARSAARGRPAAGRRRDRRRRRRDRRPADAGRVQGSSVGLEGGLRGSRREAAGELRGPAVGQRTWPT